MQQLEESQGQQISFDHFGFKEALIRAIKEAGFTKPSPIQEKVIPLILSGMDLIGQAQTGTGKTAAFGLPVINMLGSQPGVEMLIITPTRELSSQVSEEIQRLGRYCGVSCTTIYGGQSFSRQISAVKAGAKVVVATPGRLLDLLESKRLGNFNPKIVVLDEADEMLDMGFLEDIQKIFTFLPAKRQTLLFSATMPEPIQHLARKILKDPQIIKITQKEITSKDITQFYVVVQEQEREEAMMRLFDTRQLSKAIVFCKTKKDVDHLAHLLASRGYPVKGLHGDMPQGQREDVIDDFRSGNVQILIATDVAARGLNVVDVTHVFNYHFPYDKESYVHRIGRTGRGGRKGEAITFVTPLELKKLLRMHQSLGSTIAAKFLPTLQEVRKMRLEKLILDLENQEIEKETYAILGALKEGEQSIEQFACKMLSFFLAKEKLQGKQRIGVDDSALERLLQHSHSSSMKEPSQNTRRRPPFKKKFSDKGKKKFYPGFRK